MPCTVFIFKHLTLSEWDCFEFAGRDDVDRSLTRLQIFSTRRFTKRREFRENKNSLQILSCFSRFTETSMSQL